MTMQAPGTPELTRRAFGRQGLALGGACLLPLQLALQPAHAAAPPEFQAALQRLTGGAQPRAGRVQIDIAPLVENGNAVPVVISLDSPQTPNDHVQLLALLTERNPQPDVAVFQLSALSGRARVATRMRLATSQTIWALARTSDGSWWQQGADVVVTLAACVEGA